MRRAKSAACTVCSVSGIAVHQAVEVFGAFIPLCVMLLLPAHALNGAAFSPPQQRVLCVIPVHPIA